jgi:hypothetical protein
VVVQTALAVVLLISAGLMIRTFQALRQVHPGFTGLAQLQTFRIDIAEGQVKEQERVLRMQQEIRRKLAEIPGVTSVSFANSVPTDGNNSTDVLYAEDRVYAEGQLPPLRRFKLCSGIFQTMGTRLTREEISRGRISSSAGMWPWYRELCAGTWLRWRPRSARIREGAKDEADYRRGGRCPARRGPEGSGDHLLGVAMSNFWGNGSFCSGVRCTRCGRIVPVRRV